MKQITIFLSALSILIITIFSSCQKVEDIVDFPVKDPALVLNCYFSPDSIWKFEVSRSLSVIDNAPLSIVDGATIKLYEDDVQIATVTQTGSKGYYIYAGNNPKAGHSYKVEVNHPKYISISSSNEIPEKIDFDVRKIKIKDSSTYYDPWKNIYIGNAEVSANLHFKDPGNQENYYLAYLMYYDSFDINYIVKATVYIESNNPLVDNKYTEGLLFLDQYFNNQEIDISFDFYDYAYYSGKQYYMVLESMSKSKYLYEKSINMYFDADGNPFAEPVQVYNNIKNGYGVFAGFTNNVFVFKL